MKKISPMFYAAFLNYGSSNFGTDECRKSLAGTWATSRDPNINLFIFQTRDLISF